MTLHDSFKALVIAAGCVLAGCSETDGELNGGRPPAPESSTTRVLQIAQQPDDTAEPFAVNNGAFSFNDTAEDTQPQAINNTP